MYDFNAVNQQLQDLQKQYQQWANYQQPTQQPTFQQPQAPVLTRQVQYVDGIAGARLYQQNLPPNSSEIIADKEVDLLYVVSKDANGIPAKEITALRFQKEKIEEEPVFLTRKDFDDFKEEIRQMFTAQTQPQTEPQTKTESAKTSSSKS